MWLRWRCVILVGTLVASHLVTPTISQETTPATETTSSAAGESEPTPPPSPAVAETDPPNETPPDTPSPVAEETDPPDTPSPVDEEEQDTPDPEEATPETPAPSEVEELPVITPSPVEEEPVPPDTPSPTEDAAPKTPAPVEQEKTPAPVSPSPSPVEAPETPSPTEDATVAETLEPTVAETPENTTAAVTLEPTTAETPEATAAATPQPTVAETPGPTVASTTEDTVAATPEATVAATPEPTVAATAEATVAATPEVTVGATPEPTVAATTEATVAATPEATVAETPEPTVAATTEATVAATPEATFAETPEPTVAATTEATVAATAEATVAETPESTVAATIEATVAATPEATFAETPEPTVAATTEATVAATAEAPVAETPDPTVAATIEATVAATPEPTVAATPEPTVAATVEATVAATPEATVAETPEPTVAETPDATEAVTPEPTVRWTFAPADPWTESPGATPAPQREWTPPPTVKQTWAPAAPWTASPGATPAPQRVWTPPPTVKQTWAPAAPWTASPGATPAPVAPWTISPGATWAPVAPWTASPGATPAPTRVWTPPPTVTQTWAPVAPWTASPGATWAPVSPWTASPGATWAPVAPWTASPGATWAPAVPWTASPGATWAPAAPWTSAPGATWAPGVPWTGPPTIALLDLVATTRAANTAGEYEGQFDTVLAALDYTGLTALLDGQALMTMFLPTDEAFEAEGITNTSVITLPQPTVQNLLLYHLLEGAVGSEIVAESADFHTLLKVNLDVEEGGNLVDGEGNSRSIVGDELRASNGYAHVVDGVLFPADLLTLATNVNAEGGSFEGVFDIFLAGVARTGLGGALSGVNGLYTVFAPADFAFESIGITNETVLTFDVDTLTTVLSYHVITNEAVDNSTLRGSLREFDTMLQGNTLRNSLSGGVLDDTGVEANVLAADLQAVNGLVHVIDIVLEPYPLFTQSPTAAPTPAPTLLDLVHTLEMENGDTTNDYFGMFDTMIAALSASGLDLELAQPGPFTLFVPTDAAFMDAGLGPANVASLPPTVLENLLLYHTLSGAVARDAIAQEDTLFTALELNDLKVPLATSGATLIDSGGNAVNIFDADVECANGYLHYVDAVLMPPDLMWSLESYNEPGGSLEGAFDTFLEAMRITNTSDSFKGMSGPYTILAPTDSAFEALQLTPLNIGETNQTALRELLRYHIVEGEVSTNSMGEVDTLRTLNGVAGNGGTLAVSGAGILIEDAEGGEAEVLEGNLASSNGVVHAIGSVLLPFPVVQLTVDMFPSSPEGGASEDSSNGNVEVAALSAGLAAALILVAAAIAVHKRRQADAAKPPQVAPDDEGWGGATAVRGAPIHPA